MESSFQKPANAICFSSQSFCLIFTNFFLVSSEAVVFGLEDSCSTFDNSNHHEDLCSWTCCRSTFGYLESLWLNCWPTYLIGVLMNDTLGSFEIASWEIWIVAALLSIAVGTWVISLGKRRSFSLGCWRWLSQIFVWLHLCIPHSQYYIDCIKLSISVSACLYISNWSFLCLQYKNIIFMNSINNF